MVKLTVDLIEGAGQYINPIRDRELDLRFCPFSFSFSMTCSCFAGATRYLSLRIWEQQWTSSIVLTSVTTRSGEIDLLTNPNSSLIACGCSESWTDFRTCRGWSACYWTTTESWGSGSLWSWTCPGWTPSCSQITPYRLQLWKRYVALTV